MGDDFCKLEKTLSEDEKRLLDIQNSRLVSEHKSTSLEKDAKKFWDLFYKRNETRFFKDRHWTTREFEELLDDAPTVRGRKVLFEIGCGVGNLIFPLLDECNLYVIACDFSPRAVEMVRSDDKFDPERMRVFQADITTQDVLGEIEACSVDIATLVFVLSAIHPQKFIEVLRNVFAVLKPGGVVLFRDYGLYDMAQMRFKAGHKISENFYMRQDGTR